MQDGRDEASSRRVEGGGAAGPMAATGRSDPEVALAPELIRRLVLDALGGAAEGRPRHLIGSALRSIFHTLKGHKVYIDRMLAQQHLIARVKRLCHTDERLVAALT